MGSVLAEQNDAYLAHSKVHFKTEDAALLEQKSELLTAIVKKSNISCWLPEGIYTKFMT
jgi:hypothetical protein